MEVLAKQVIITVDMRFPENDLLDNKMFIIGKGSKNKTHDFVILFLKNNIINQNFQGHGHRASVTVNVRCCCILVYSVSFCNLVHQ